MGPIWGRQDPDGPHAVPMNFALWEGNLKYIPTKHESANGLRKYGRGSDIWLISVNAYQLLPGRNENDTLEHIHLIAYISQ